MRADPTSPLPASPEAGDRPGPLPPGSRADAEFHAPATRVLTYAVRPGKEQEFRDWHWSLADLARHHPGYLGSDLVPPTAGDPNNQWTVVYRYEDEESLEAWLDSRERAKALAAAPDVYAGERAEYALGGNVAPDRSVTIVASHRVVPGREEEYRAANRALNEVAAGFPGFNGVEIFAPTAENDEFTVLVRFDCQENMDRWIHSPERARGLEEQFRHTTSHHSKVVATGFGSWFAFNAIEGVQAAAWKQAMVVLSVLFPIVMTFGLTGGQLLSREGASAPVGTFVGNVVIIATLTWVAMPIVTRLMDWWLTPRCHAGRTALGVALLVATYAAELWAFSRIAANP